MRTVLCFIVFLHFAVKINLSSNISTSDSCTSIDAGQKQCGSDKYKCIDQKQFCDGTKDCPNGFDEENCHDDLPTLEEFLEMERISCKPDEFQCSNKKCIPLENVCNGKIDCKNGDDEGGHCNKCQDYGCVYRCQDFPTGPKCICQSNDFLSIDEKSCEPQAKCNTENYHCSQHCSQLHDRVVCYCSPGYSLEQGDCRVIDEYRNGQLFFTYNDKSIRRLNLFGKSNNQIIEEFLPSTQIVKKVADISFNQNRQLLYFVDVEPHHTSKIFFSDGSVVQEIFFGRGVKHIAVDWITNNIYYAADGWGIGVCSSNGRFCSYLIHGHTAAQNEHIQTYGDLIVHPKRGILIWLDYNANYVNGAIMAAGMEGKHPRIVVQMSIKRLITIAIDYVRDHLYYSAKGQLQLIDLKTLRKKQVSAEILPFSLISFDNSLYYISRNHKNLYKFKNSSNYLLSDILNGTDFSMTVNNSLYYETFSDPCKASNCSHMCVLRESVNNSLPRHKCICPDNYSFDNNGNCVLNKSIKGPVRTSATFMDYMCNKNEACYNDGVCPEDSFTDGEYTPFCICQRGFNGLYCENYTPGNYEEISILPMIAFMMLLFLIIMVASIIGIMKLYPEITHKMHGFASIKDTSRILSRLNRPVNTMPRSFSASPVRDGFPNNTLLINNENSPQEKCQIQQPVRIATSFSNPSFSTPQQHHDTFLDI